MTKTIERRVAFADFQLRDAPDGAVGLRGYAAVFDYVAHGEVVKRSAFNRTLNQRDKVKLLVNHDGVPIASTDGGTMSLSVDERGLLVDVSSLDLSNPTVQELVSAMRRGDITEMSFAFEAKDAPLVDGVRELREVKLYDVSVVTYAWYDATEVQLNSFDNARLAFRSLSPEQQRELICIEVNIDGSTISDSSVDNSTEAPEPCPNCGMSLDGSAPAADPAAGMADAPMRAKKIATARALLELANA